MFSKQFLDTLSRLNGYSDKVILKYPKTVLCSPAQDVIVTLNSQDLGCEQFENTGIYELGKFISMMNLFENPQIERIDDTIKIQSTTESAVFTLCNLELLKNYDQSAGIVDGLDKFEIAAEFDLTKEALQHFKKASSILSELNALKITGKNGNTDVNIGFHNRFNSSSNTYKREFLGTSNRDFEINLGVENVNKLPLEDYKVKVFYSQERDAYRTRFEAKDFRIVILALVNSNG